MKNNSHLIRNIKKFALELARIYNSMGIAFMLRYFSYFLKNITTVISTGSLSILDKQVNSLVKVKYQGHKFVLTPDAMPAIRELMLKNCYGFDMNRKYNTVLDLGANRGVFTVMAAKVSNTVISIECNKDELPLLYERTMRLNDITNSYFINKFASNVTSNETISLGSIINDFNINEISYLKIDIEGAEKNLLEDNLEWIGITKEIAIEVHPCFGVNEQKIYSLLVNNGFSVSLFDKDLNEVNKLNSAGMGYIRAFR